MDIIPRAKFHFNRLMLTLMFGIQASESHLGPGELLKRPGLIGLTSIEAFWEWSPCLCAHSHNYTVLKFSAKYYSI